MSFIDSIKSFYYKLEDKWYDFLDKVNEKIPVYKIIEPIDKIFPSFLLFLIIVFLILFSIIFLLIAPLFAPAVLSVTISVSDADGMPINGADVSIQLSDDNSIFNSGITDEFGEFKFELEKDQESLDAIISAEAEGYEKKQQKETIVKGSSTTIKLNKLGGQGGQTTLSGETSIYEIKVVDKKTKTILSKIDISVSLSCGSGSITPNYLEDDYGEFKVEKPANCSPLYVVAKADGYVDSTKQVVLKTQFVIELSKESLEETKGKLKVTVYDEKNSTLSDVIVLLVTADNTEKRELVTDIFGSVLFDDLSPGQYNISATQQNAKKITRIAEKKGIQVNSGKIKEETLNFPEFGEGTHKIIFKVTDSKDKNAVSSVGITLYKDGVQLKVSKSYTDAEGKFTLLLDEPDKDANFKALLFKEDYVPRAVSLNVISKDAKEVQEFFLDKYIKGDPLNAKYGSVIVNVVDEENLPVENATTSIFDSATNIPFYTADTNKDGQTFFEPLPAGNYYAKSANEQNTKLGQSDSKELKNGETLTLEVKLTTGKTKIEVIALNAKNLGQKIEKALAEFYSMPANSNEEGIFVTSCITNKDGNCSVTLDTKYQDVYVKVSKEGYMSYIAGNNGHNIILVANDNIQVTAKLYEIEQGDPTSGISVHAIGVYGGSAAKPWGTEIGDLAITLGSDKEKELDYYALFDVFVYEPDEDANNIFFNIRAGNEKAGIVSIMDYVNGQGDPAYLDSIEPLRMPSLKSVSVSPCVDLTNPKKTLFAMPNCPSQILNGKSSLAETTKLANIVIPVIVHFKIRKNVKLGTIVTLISNTKISENESILDAESGTINRQIGDSMTLDQIKLQCQQLPPGKDLIWQQLTMEKDLESTTETVVSQARSDADKQNNIWNFGSVDDPILSKQDYFMHYVLFNCSDKEKNNLSLKLATAGTFTINNQPVQEFSGVEIGGYSILKEPEETTLNFPSQNMDNPIKHMLDLNLLQSSNILAQAKVNYNVANLDYLFLALDQTYLIPDKPILISGETLTGKKLKVGNANIRLNKIVGEQYQEITTIVSENEDDSKGSFVVSVPANAKIGDIYQLTASKNGYMPAPPLILKVAYPSNYAKIKCIEKSDKSLDYILPGSPITFTLENKCAIDLNIDFVDQDNEFTYSPTISEFPQYPQYPAKRVELKTGESKEITLTAKGTIIQGIHPIYLTASNSFIKKTSAGLIEVTVIDTKSAFSLQSFTFDFKQGVSPVNSFSLFNVKPYYNKMPEQASIVWLLDYFAVSPEVTASAIGDNFSQPKCETKAGIDVTLNAKYSCYDKDFTAKEVLLTSNPVTLPVSLKLDNLADITNKISAEAKDACTKQLKEQLEKAKPTDINTANLAAFIDSTYFNGFYYSSVQTSEQTSENRHYTWGGNSFGAYNITAFPDRFWLENPVKEKDVNDWDYLFGSSGNILIADYTGSDGYVTDLESLFKDHAQNLFDMLKKNIEGQIGSDSAPNKAYYSPKSISTIINKFVSLMDEKLDALEGGKSTNCYYSRFRKEFDAYLRANIILWFNQYDMDGREAEKQYLESDIFTPELLEEMDILATGVENVFIAQLNLTITKGKPLNKISDLPASENISLDAVSDVELQSYDQNIDLMIDALETQVVAGLGSYPALNAFDYYALVYYFVEKVSQEYDKKISGRCIDYYWKEALLNSVTKRFIGHSKIQKKLNKWPEDISLSTVNAYLNSWGIPKLVPPLDEDSEAEDSEAEDSDYEAKLKKYKSDLLDWQKKIACKEKQISDDLTCLSNKITYHCIESTNVDCCKEQCSAAMKSLYPDIDMLHTCIQCNCPTEVLPYCWTCNDTYSSPHDHKPCSTWYAKCKIEIITDTCTPGTNFQNKIQGFLTDEVFNKRLSAILDKIMDALGKKNVETIEANVPSIAYDLEFKLKPSNAAARYWVTSSNSPNTSSIVNLACDNPIKQDKFSSNNATNAKTIPFNLNLINPFVGDVYKDLTIADVIDYGK